ncbi:MAG: hypothetical protein N3G19_00535 [Candidatus Pacearchaeota archaeon]|nr:hypothetical protein [Candidatus Pacearchaeota archaeon]
MKEKILLAIVVAIVFVMILSINALALGISPGRATFNFEPNAEKQVTLTIVNTEHKAMNVSVRVEGEWADRIELNQTSLEFAPEDESKSLIYKIKFPLNADFDGIKAKIVAIETPIGQGTVTTRIAVEHQLYIITGKTGKIGKTSDEKINVTKIYAKNYTRGKEAIVEIDIFNPTEKTLEVYSTMLIYDKSDLKSEFNSTIETIGPNSSKTLEAFWNLTEFEIGNYSGKILVYYDNETFEQDLKIEIKEDFIIIEFGELNQMEIEKQEKTTKQKQDLFSKVLLFLKNRLNPIIIATIVLIIIVIIALYFKYRKLSKISDKRFNMKKRNI